MRKGFVLPLIIVGLVIIAAIGVAIYATFFSTKPAPLPLATSSPQASPTSQIDETIDWKTYENDFASFKIPPGWIYEKNTDHANDGLVYSGKFFRDTNLPYIFTFSVYENSQTYGSTADDYLAYYKNLSLTSKASIIVNSSERKVGKNRYGINIDIGGIDVSQKVVFDNNGKLYEFALLKMAMDQEELKVNNEILDKILSSFQFLD